MHARTGIPAAAIALLCVLVPGTSQAQLSALHEFDGGGDGTSWDDAANWEQVLDPNGNPISGNPSAPPDAITSADIPLAGVVIDASMPGQTALDVWIATSDGAGSLGMSGGDLTVRDLLVGGDTNGIHAGGLTLSDGTLIAGDDILIGGASMGTMNVTGGSASTADDFVIDANGRLEMSGGTISIGDRLTLQETATLTLSDGDLVVNDDLYLFGDSQVTVDDGLLVVADKLRFDDDPARNGKLTINGGIVRSNEFGQDTFRGLVEINGDGVYQVESPDLLSPVGQLSVAAAMALILDGVHFTSSSGALVASTVIVPEFFGEFDVPFTQISVPEPAPVVLLAALLPGFGALALAIRTRRTRLDATAATG